MKSLLSVIFALVLLASPGLVTAVPSLAARTIHVPADYASIQAAINAASDGDTIVVAPGLYKESLNINKSLTLKGAQAGVDARNRSGSETIIEPGLDKIGINITTTANQVVAIDGLTIQNAAHAVATPQFGLMAANITVRNVRVLNCTKFGISLTFAASATVEHCYVERVEIAINAGAVVPAPGTVATFRNNKVVNSRFGISGYLEHSLIEGNLIKDFADGGVGIGCQCLNTTIRNNTVTGYAKGAALTFEKSHHDRPSSEHVTVIGNNFTKNRHGVYVFDTQETLTGIAINFNNIADNYWSGISNAKRQTLKAARNWWGDASGPLHRKLNRDGTGDPVSDNVDFEPWLGAPLISVKTQVLTGAPGIIDAKKEADTEIGVNGTATLTLARYASNPGTTPTCFAPLDKYVDVYLPDAGDVTGLQIRLYYTDGELAAAGVTEESLRLFSWNGTAWVQCSASGVNATSSNSYTGYVWADIARDSRPTLAQLAGTPFAAYGPRFLQFSIATTELPAGKEGVSYEARLEACAGAEPYTWAITSGKLPDGLGLNATTGIISGTPTRAATFHFTIMVTDAHHNQATAQLAITIASQWPCLIATAAFGTDVTKEIDALREFRDEVLLPNRLGANLVSLYYHVSPAIASLISEHELLRTAVRVGFVEPIVKILTWSHDLWSTEA